MGDPSARSVDGPRARGNLTALVVFDSRASESVFNGPTLFSALRHFGVPARGRDLAAGTLRADELTSAPLIVLGQPHLGSVLGADVSLILDAVDAGAGLVNLDHALDEYRSDYHAALRLSLRRPVIGSTTSVGVRDSDHPITWLQAGAAVHRLHRPVDTRLIGPAADFENLLEGDDGAPLLIAGRLGAGRIVQWMVSPRIWLSQYLGHASGLDDVWLRALLWAARKPIVIKPMPPFFRFRFDDCQGLWDNAEDFEFARVIGEFGHIPSLSFCLRASRSSAAEIGALYRQGTADFSPHVLEPMTSIYYGDRAGEYDAATFAAIFAELDDVERALGIRFSRVVSDHGYATSIRALPYLRERKMTNKMNVCAPGETWNGLHRDWRPAPYGSMSYAFDFQPPPAEDFFVAFNNDPPSFDAARAKAGEEHFLFNREGAFGALTWDFLHGLVGAGTTPTNDIAGIVDRLVRHTRLGLNSGFFGGSISHSPDIRQLSAGEWREVMRRFRAQLTRHELEPVSYDAIADYARNHVSTAITGARLEGDRIRVGLTGPSAVPVRLAIYRDAEIGDVEWTLADAVR